MMGEIAGFKLILWIMQIILDSHVCTPRGQRRTWKMHLYGLVEKGIGRACRVTIQQPWTGIILPPWIWIDNDKKSRSLSYLSLPIKCFNFCVNRYNLLNSVFCTEQNTVWIGICWTYILSKKLRFNAEIKNNWWVVVYELSLSSRFCTIDRL